MPYMFHPSPGCISEGDTFEGALKNMREAIELYLEPNDDLIEFQQKKIKIEEVAD